MRPRIGITLGERTKPNVIEQYARYVEEAGGEPLVLLPGQPVPDELDGLVLGGGADVHPSEYGAEVDPRTVPEPERDAFERPIAERALSAEVPVLGICRGFQLLNVLHGGKLIQHLDGHTRDESGESRKHEVRVAAGSRLHAALGKADVQVNSSHHQGVVPELLAPTLEAVATTADGLIEAVEGRGPTWVVAVQWHPERVDELDPANREIARVFVAAARDRSRARRGVEVPTA